MAYTSFQPAFDSDATDPVSTFRDTSEQEQYEFLNHPIKNLIGMSSESRELHVLKDVSSLAEIVMILSRGIHHVLILPTVTESPIFLLSQSDVLRYLWSHNESLGNVLDLHVQDIQSRKLALNGSDEIYAPPVTILVNQTARFGFKKMWAHNVRDVAIVTDKGGLVSSLDASCLRGLTKVSQWEEVSKPVMVFLRAVKVRLIECRFHLHRDYFRSHTFARLPIGFPRSWPEWSKNICTEFMWSIQRCASWTLSP